MADRLLLRRAASALVALVLAGVVAGCGSGGGTVSDEVAGVGAGIPPPPSPEVAALAGAMSDDGKRAFYGAEPRILERAELAVECKEVEFGLILGCYGDGRIAILRVTRPEIVGVMEVTAAHEMLHAVYATMPAHNRVRVDRLVEQAYAKVTDPRIRGIVAEYERHAPTSRPIELHAILGTEVEVLDAELAEHYRRYFTSREHVVATNRTYLGAFEAVERRIAALRAENDVLVAEMEVVSARIDAGRAAVADIDARLNALRAKGDARAYNALLPRREAQIDSVNEMIARYNQLAKAHNAKVDELAAIALEQNQLVTALEGKAPIPG